jgi:hypothetical protein
MNTISILRIIITILIIITIIGWSYFYRKFREPAAIAPLTWLVNILAFYLYRFYTLSNLAQGNLNLLNLWSSILHLHGVILLLFGAFIANARLIHNKSYMERLAKKIHEGGK